MLKTELTKKALLIAEQAHAGQYRNDGVTPYIVHPLAVAENFKDDEMAICAALLHDVIEDSYITSDDLLKMGIPYIIVRAVVLLTKQKGQPYINYLLNIKDDPIATKVKIKDIEHNIQTVSGNLKAKYELALYLLENL